MIDGLFILNVADWFKAKPRPEGKHILWRVNVTCASPGLDGSGTVVKRSRIKDIVGKLHGVILNTVMDAPTCEMIALYICSKLAEEGIDAKQVAVCEADEGLPNEMQSWAVFAPVPKQNVNSGRGIHPDLRGQEQE